MANVVTFALETKSLKTFVPANLLLLLSFQKITKNMTTDFNIPDIPLPPDSCPISELLGKRVTQMDDKELDKYVTDLRSVSESPQSLRKSLIRKGSSSVKSKPKVDLSLLGEL